MSSLSLATFGIVSSSLNSCNICCSCSARHFWAASFGVCATSTEEEIKTAATTSFTGFQVIGRLYASPFLARAPISKNGAGLSSALDSCTPQEFIWSLTVPQLTFPLQSDERLLQHKKGMDSL